MEKIQFFESHSNKRFSSLSHMKKSWILRVISKICYILWVILKIKGLILWGVFKKNFNSVSHVTEGFNSLSHNFWEKGSILWIIFLKGLKSSHNKVLQFEWYFSKIKPILWVIFRKIQSSILWDISKRKLNSLSHLEKEGGNSSSHIFKRVQFFGSHARKS